MDLSPSSPHGNPHEQSPPSQNAPLPSGGQESFIELLVETLHAVDRPVRAQFLQRFFKAMAHVDLPEALSLEYWEQILARRQELSASLGKPISLKTAIVDVLASTSFLRTPVLMEYEELKKLQVNAATDALTGLYNRRLFDEYFAKELNRAQRYSHHLALVIMDLHRFKEVNDRSGHLAGDQALQIAATTMRKTLRTSDYAFRIGGDEFALLLQMTDPGQAEILSRRLRSSYESAIAPLKLDVPLALDYGVAIYPEDGDQREVLVTVADERLYRLKNASRRAAGLPPSGPARGERAAAHGPATPAQQYPSAQRPASPQPARVIALDAPSVRENHAAAARPTGAAAEGAPSRADVLKDLPAMPAAASAPAAPPAAASMDEGLASTAAAIASAAAAMATRAERRKWERVSLAGTRAYAVLGDNPDHTAKVLDLSYGGVALEMPRRPDAPSSFHAILHVPILPPVRVSLQTTYVEPGDSPVARVGCVFLS